MQIMCQPASYDTVTSSMYEYGLHHIDPRFPCLVVIRTQVPHRMIEKNCHTNKLCIVCG